MWFAAITGEALLNILINVGLGLATTVMCVGALVWATSGGNEERISRGRSIIIHALEGAVLIMTAKIIVAIVLHMGR